MKIKLVEKRNARRENSSDYTPIYINLGEYDRNIPRVEFDWDRTEGPYIRATLNIPGEDVLRCFDLPKNVLNCISEEGTFFDWSHDATDEFTAYGPDEDDGSSVLRTDNEEAVAARILDETVLPVLYGIYGYQYSPQGYGRTRGWPKQGPDIVWDQLAESPRAQKWLAAYNCTLDDLHEYVRQAHDPATIKRLAKVLKSYDGETDAE